MKSTWLFACISTFAVHVYAAPVTTEDTFVVATSVSKRDTERLATEGSKAHIKLMEMRVRSDIALRYARTAVVTHVLNPTYHSHQATFHVLLPETAFISGFAMTLAGKTYPANVKEREQAKKIYGEAVSQGFSAAYISAKARDSNHFTVSVNVEPNTEAVFNLTYEELLVRRNGVYNHAINLHPGAPVLEMEVTVRIKECQRISLLRIPELRTGNEIDATEDDAQSSNVTLLKSENEKEVTITFSPDQQEQMKLMQVYKQKIKSASSYRSYNNRRYIENTTGILGQFVVQYDVERLGNEEILVNNGYFVHFFAPQSLKPLSKHAVFVLDTSGSMMGRKIDQLKEAMNAIFTDLHPTDFFNIVEFNSKVKVHKLSEATEMPMRTHYMLHYRDVNVELSPPSIATPENIAKAQIIVSRLVAGGGTNIHQALDVAVDLTNKKFDVGKNDSKIAKNTTEPDIFKVDLQPIIIFLTDGDATEGETNPTRMVSAITAKNSDVRRASLFSLAFGQDADRNLLRKLSLHNGGFMRHIYEAADAALQLRHFYSQISSPLLSNVNFNYPPEQIKKGTVTRHKFNTIFAGSEVVMAGKMAPGATELAPLIQAFCADNNNHSMVWYEVRNRAEVTSAHLPLERMWAYLTIKQLLDEQDAKETNTNKENCAEKRALAIALGYEFVTPLTSLVVVKPNATNAVDAKSADNTSLILLSGQVQPPAVEDVTYFDQTEDDQDTNRMSFVGSDVPDRGFIFNLNGRRSHNLFIPLIETTPAPTTTVSWEKINHLEGYSWALSLFNSDTKSIEFSTNGTNVILEISRSSNPPKDIPESECTQSVIAENGTREAGVCVYLTRCAAARSIAPDLYRDTYCVVQNNYAGVCCLKNNVDT